MITVTSPIFSSIDFTSNQFNLSSGFQVQLRTDHEITAHEYGTYLPESNTWSDGGLDATLVCDDNDIFHMYVKP